MERKKQASIQIPTGLYERISRDAERFQFSFSGLVCRILGDFYRARFAADDFGGSPLTDEELDKLSEEAGSPNNPFRYASLEEAMKFLRRFKTGAGMRRSGRTRAH
ncbi:MAG: hypothetical protein LBP65_03385 [Puniceicoccales bacterium]|jgi:hypothetical protein|nr:hypothetical protein [Puniceicoccales bacterium]